MKRMFTKSKTKADILSMLDRMIAQHGDAMSIPMLRVDQSDHLKLYTCALTTGFLQAMICRLPRSLENPEGIQRALVMKKVSEIEERPVWLSQRHCYHPQMPGQPLYNCCPSGEPHQRLLRHCPFDRRSPPLP